MAYRPPEQVGAPRTRQGGIPQKYVLDDYGRRLITELYDGTSARIDMIAKAMPGVPRDRICRWAIEMGIAQKRLSRSQWTHDEDEILRKNIGKVPVSHLQKRLNKSRMTIIRRIQHLSLIKERSEDYYTLYDIIVPLHVNWLTAMKWIEKGWLKGKKTISDHNWIFRSKDIRDFIFAHPSEINPRKLDQETWLWLVDILSGEEGIGELGKQMRGEKE